MATRTKRRAIECFVMVNFNTAGVTYLKGQRFPVETALDWPDGALDGRVKNGFIKMVTSVEEIEAPSTAKV